MLHLHLAHSWYVLSFEQLPREGLRWTFLNSAYSHTRNSRLLVIVSHGVCYSISMNSCITMTKTKCSSCLQIARAFGASDIIAVDVQDEKLEKAKTFGATATINSKIEDPIERIKEITGGRGVDIAVEALGKPLTFSQCTQSVRDGGKAVMIGLAQAGAIEEIDINRLVRRKVQVIGSYGGRARQDLPKLVKLAESGIFNIADAVTRKYGFEEAGKAFQDLNQGKIFSRVVVEIM
ncbi:hypothetical protein DKX38_029288 [Salix brachista]|uniref:Alcohol dehydrogenase-like C-terminal domain-containing protein n=1 Tax=Salix brachista TaxID=2182728 RepID=A0A5N5J2A4_9ROSI|nr:hypothetical protein DKX38_029288 [Salix brachista]